MVDCLASMSEVLGLIPMVWEKKAPKVGILGGLPGGFWESTIQS
jgi:hypothetical protein